LLRFNALFDRLLLRRAQGDQHAISYAKFFSRSHDVMIHVYDAASNVIETHAHKASSKNSAPVS
jgi:hypothetical protein